MSRQLQASFAKHLRLEGGLKGRVLTPNIFFAVSPTKDWWLRGFDNDWVVGDACFKGMAMVPAAAWELVPGALGPTVAAPGSTTAVHFVQQLQANSALAGPEAGENMRKLCLRLLTLQGWETVDDIREGVTEAMLTAAHVHCEVGAGYYKQFLRHLGTPEGPHTAKKHQAWKHQRMEVLRVERTAAAIVPGLPSLGA